jgi:hypothetical protein
MEYNFLSFYYPLFASLPFETHAGLLRDLENVRISSAIRDDAGSPPKID